LLLPFDAALWCCLLMLPSDVAIGLLTDAAC